MAAILALLSGGAGLAAEAPVLMPNRDVAVTYRTEQDGRMLEQRTRWSMTLQRLRIEPPSPGMFVLVDYAARRMDIVREVDRSYVEMPAPPTLPGVGAPASGRYRQGADDRVAGLRCTEWASATPGPPAGLCLTADGVLLRVRIGPRTIAAASAVSYARQDPALFRVPDGYTRVVPPR